MNGFPSPDKNLPDLTTLLRFREVLTLLWTALDEAHELGCDPWEFALELRELQRNSVSVTDLRWLCQQGIVAVAREVTNESDLARQFRPQANLCFREDTCFVMSERGGQLVKAFIAELVVQPDQFQSEPPGSDSRVIPIWDRERKELTFHGELVKRFRQPCPNQSLILETFEELRWPSRIDDPLPPLRGCDPKQRLRETITSLNKKQQRSLILFRGDGSGEGILWEDRQK